MNRKIIDILFAFIIFALPFNFIPRILWLPAIGDPFGANLVIYPLLFSLVYTVYSQWKYGNVFYKWKTFRKFIVSYLIVLLISLTWGLIIYPYYDLILSSPVNQIEKLPKVWSMLNNSGILISKKSLLKIWMGARFAKAILIETFYTFGAAYMIFCWYHDNHKRAIDILLKVSTLNLIIIALYGLVDVCYQNGQMWAQNTLIVLNSSIHANMGWQTISWIPQVQFFRDAQNRSLFTEPSAYGIYMAFAYPLLWWDIFRSRNKKKKIALWILFVIITFEIFLSQSRLALAVNFGVFAVFIISCIYLKTKKILLLLLALFFGGTVAFGGAMAFLRYGQVPAIMGDWKPLATEWKKLQQIEDEKKGFRNINANEYFTEGLASLSSNDESSQHAISNHSRFTLEEKHIQIGLEHPLIGVGIPLRQGYLREKLDKDSGVEIQAWNKTIDKIGPLRGGFPNLGEFTCRFAETGLLGLISYLIPFFHLLLLYIKRCIKMKKDLAPYIFSGISLIGIFATGLGDWMNVFFCYWVALAMGYIINDKNESIGK